MSKSIMEMLDNILIGKVSYDTDISETELRNNLKFMEYYSLCMSGDDETLTLNDAVDYATEMAYNDELKFAWDNN
jgi:hypothetical protein